MENKKDSMKLIAENKKAFFNFHIIDRYEAGVVLLGHEVKSIRCGSVNFKDSYVSPSGYELFLHDFHIAGSSVFGTYNPDRKRKLLLHKSEIIKLISKINEKGLTMIPLRIYFLKQYVKIEIGLAKGKTNYDKKQTIQEREMKREIREEKW